MWEDWTVHVYPFFDCQASLLGRNDKDHVIRVIKAYFKLSVSLTNELCKHASKGKT
jgi:hypothetical protein